MSVHPITDNLPAMHVREIGRITVKWAYLEWRLMQITCLLLEINAKQGRLALAQPRACNHLDMIQDLMGLQEIKVTGVSFPELRTVLEEAGNMRNAIAHGIWLDVPESGDPVLQLVRGTYPKMPGKPKIKRVITPQGITAPISNLRKLVTMIDACQRVLKILEGKIRCALAASREKLQEQSA